jgi:hypothetical protein
MKFIKMVEECFVQWFSLADFPLERHDPKLMLEDMVHPITELA